jgi:RNA polymerase sigma-70 factor (ECF subfamily)
VRDAIERVYREHRQGLYTLALSITRCPSRAEDAVQEAFARLWSARVRPIDPVPYVFAAVRHAAIDQTRRAASAARAESASIYNGWPPSHGALAGRGASAGETPGDPASAVLTAEEHQQVRDAVETLSEAEREAVVLRVYGGLTFEQMAETLGEPLPTVASRYRRALETLAHRIKTEKVGRGNAPVSAGGAAFQENRRAWPGKGMKETPHER